MGAKQSKRSVDISGKEAEGGGEVAAAGAGGEGRVEQLADADALKPQLNGDAHIQLEQTDKEKEMDSGTPENEKDATTEKEGKEDDDKEKEQAPVTNGESETKVENGESTPTPEDGKKPKKEKVKKKWSLRSISFSRKDKPKQEKKQKEDEPKTNGEPEKVPEETAEAVPEAAANEVAEEVKAPAEEKDEKTPETPVTEPLTNGTSTPETPKAETPASEAAVPSPATVVAASEPAAPSPIAASEAAAPSPPADEPAPQLEPDQLPVNGLSLEEPKPEIPEIEKPEETKPEPPAAETVEIVPAPEIPKEVCVERMPLLEPTPPPLPANPPPSSVASFAATTMAPELTDASLANTADATIAPLSALPETKDIPQSLAQPALNELENETSFVSKETKEVVPDATVCEPEITNSSPEVMAIIETSDPKQDNEAPKEVAIKAPSNSISDLKETSERVTETKVIESLDTVNETVVSETLGTVTGFIVAEIGETDIEVKETTATVTETVAAEIPKDITDTSDVLETVAEPILDKITETCDTLETESSKDGLPEADVLNPLTTKTESISEISEIKALETETLYNDESENKAETPTQAFVESSATETLPEPENIPESEIEISEADDSSLPPPPPIQDEEDSVVILEDVDEKVEESLKQIPEPIAESEVAIIESNHISNVETTNGIHDISPEAANETEALKKKANAALGSAREPTESSAEPRAPAVLAPCTNGAPSPHTPQEPLPVSDKLADLIPEVPDVPELKPETLQETVTDVAVAN